ncbi:hypothetical protein [Bradyrhizobium zhanjiangense]|uniref:hypothetical protein n=1 Tax=Bradyrhizobium zhanjiangense TaxID=1325107 RepID=UPI0010088A94|nr:hypothetical protein [Bradyrhizobium zhanjiangense]
MAEYRAPLLAVISPGFIFSVRAGFAAHPQRPSSDRHCRDQFYRGHAPRPIPPAFALAVLAAEPVRGDMVVCVPENGLISPNVPLDLLRPGALSTRTPHGIKIRQILLSFQSPNRTFPFRSPVDSTREIRLFGRRIDGSAYPKANNFG